MWLPLEHPPLGTQPAPQACVPTRNRTGNPLVHRLALNPLSHTSQGRRLSFNAKNNPSLRFEQSVHSLLFILCFAKTSTDLLYCTPRQSSFPFPSFTYDGISPTPCPPRNFWFLPCDERASIHSIPSATPLIPFLVLSGYLLPPAT